MLFCCWPVWLIVPINVGIDWDKNISADFFEAVHDVRNVERVTLNFECMLRVLHTDPDSVSLVNFWERHATREKVIFEFLMRASYCVKVDRVLLRWNIMNKDRWPVQFFYWCTLTFLIVRSRLTRRKYMSVIKYCGGSCPWFFDGCQMNWANLTRGSLLRKKVRAVVGHQWEEWWWYFQMSRE